MSIVACVFQHMKTNSLSSEREQESCDLGGREGGAEQHSRFQAHQMFAVASKFFFLRILCCAAISQYCRDEVVQNLVGSRLALTAQKSKNLCRVTLVRFLQPFRMLTLQLHNTSLSISIATTLLIDCLYLLQRRNDDVWSFCRYTRPCRF